MKKTILSLTLFAACTLAFSNSTGHHGPKTPDVKTPPTKPDTSGPKATTPSAPPARSNSTRDEGQRDASRLCSRWPTMLFCDRP